MNHPSAPTGLASAVRTTVPDHVLGGVAWDGRRLIVGIAGDPNAWRTRLAGIRHADLVHLVEVRHSLRDLAKLSERVITAAAAQGAPLTAIGADEGDNVVVAGLENLDEPASQALRNAFSDQPVRFVEEQIEPA